MLISFALSLALVAADGGTGGSRAVLVQGGIANADYPVDALAAKQQGVVTAKFNIGENGRASRCSVVNSSGSVQLDTRTCGIIEERFRYKPAMDASGKATDEWRTQRIAWRLPDLNALANPPATGPARAEFMLTVGTDGTVEDCLVRTSSGDPQWDSDQCRAVGKSTQFKPKIGPDGRKIRSLVLWRVR
jgi:TonB family protein